MKDMENWKGKFAARGLTVAEVKIQSDILMSDSLLPLLFAIAMILLNYILKKCSPLSKITCKDKPTYIYRWYPKNKKGQETLIQTKIPSHNIGMEFVFWKYVPCW